MNRRLFLVTAAAGAAELARAQRRGAGRGADAANLPDVIKNLKPMLDGVQPITDAERAARVEKALRLMHENKIDAILCQGGSSLYYFTGDRSPVTWVLLAKGEAGLFDDADGFEHFLKAARP